jgi:hypothetical protein
MQPSLIPALPGFFSPLEIPKLIPYICPRGNVPVFSRNLCGESLDNMPGTFLAT